MELIAITGGIACGKSSVAKIIQDLGYVVLSADYYAHEVLKNGKDSFAKIRDRYGPEIVSGDQIDRAKLADKVFSNTEERKWLESITHPEIQKLAQEDILKYQDQDFVFYEIPLLFEVNAQDRFSKILVVTCDLQIQIKRMKSRNQWSDQEIEKRIHAQLSNEEKIKRADFVIKNNSSWDELVEHVNLFIQKLKNPDASELQDKN